MSGNKTYIGIGEIHRRTVTKAILILLKQDILDATGPIQVCVGQESGCEAVIHVMRQIFAGEETEGGLLVDATNAFDSINQQAALHNISIMCPPPLFNTYQGGGEISSSEGTTQGDPYAMAMHTPMLPPTAPEVCLLCTRSMKMKRKECMANMYLKSNMASSPHSYFQPQVVWEEKLRPSTNAWPTFCL